MDGRAGNDTLTGGAGDAHIDLDGGGSIDIGMSFAGKAPGAPNLLPGQSGANGYLAFQL